jgi:hypothetical protein
VLKVLLVVLLLAAVTYGLVRVIDRRGVAGRRSGPRAAPRPEPRVQGPDDDPDFLRDLDRKRRQPPDPEDRPD